MSRFLLPLVALLVLAGRAVGQEGMKWTPTIQQACEQAKERGSLIFVTVLLDGEASNEDQKLVYHDPSVVRASRSFVNVYANPHLTHGTTKVTIDGKEREVCRDTLCTQCRDHLTAYNEVIRNFRDNEASNGDRKMPFSFVIKPDMKVVGLLVAGTVEGGFDAVPASQMANGLDQIASQFGRGLTDKEYEKAKKDLAEGERKFKAGDSRGALPHLTAVVSVNDRTVLAERANRMIDKIVEAGEGEIGKAESLAEKDPVGAVMALEELAAQYRGTRLEESAKDKIDELKRNPTVRGAMKRIASEKKAAEDLTEAEDLVAREDWAKALAKLDSIVKSYGDTAAGKKAAERAAALRADEQITKSVKEQKAAKVCKGWLSMGRSYAKNGLPDRARQQFQKVLDKFPGTSYAEEAKKELEKLK